MTGCAFTYWLHQRVISKFQAYGCGKRGPWLSRGLKIWNMCHWYGFYTLYFPMVCYRLKSLLFIYFYSYCIVVGPFLTSWFPYRSNSWRGVPCVSVVQSFPFFPFSLSKELFNSIPSMDKSCRCKSKFYSLFLFIRLGCFLFSVLSLPASVPFQWM